MKNTYSIIYNKLNPQGTFPLRIFLSFFGTVFAVERVFYRMYILTNVCSAYCYISHITKLRRNQTRPPVRLVNRYNANHSHNAPECP